jgi:hypothetical protein
MKVRVLVNCDSRARTAMFRGQEYDLPPEEAADLIADGKAEATERVKAVDGPPQDKALKTRRKKAT